MEESVFDFVYLTLCALKIWWFVISKSLLLSSDAVFWYLPESCTANLSFESVQGMH